MSKNSGERESMNYKRETEKSRMITRQVRETKRERRSESRRVNSISKEIQRAETNKEQRD